MDALSFDAPSFGRLAGLALLCAASIGVADASATVVHFPTGTRYTPIYSFENLVKNGDFNLDPLVDPENPFAANPNVTDWTISPQNPFPGTRNSNAGVGADGRGLRLGDLSLVDVSQVLSTTVGQAYRLSFFLAVDDNDAGNLLRVYTGDQLLANLDNTPYAANDTGWFSQYLYDFQATRATTTLDFQYQSPRSDQWLSNVAVLAVPEPANWGLMLAGGVAIGAWRLAQRLPQVSSGCKRRLLTATSYGDCRQRLLTATADAVVRVSSTVYRC